MADNLTQKQMIQIMIEQQKIILEKQNIQHGEFNEYKEDWKDFKEKQDKVNELVIRNDEKLKSNNCPFEKQKKEFNDRISSIKKTPFITGGVVTGISTIAIILGIILT